MKQKFNKMRGQVNLRMLIGGIVAVAFVAMVAPIVFSLAGLVNTEQCLSHLYARGYIVYADPQGVLHTEDILPKLNCTYDLGSDAYRWDNLYLCNSSIIIGEANITAIGESIEIPKLILTEANPINLTGDARTWLELRADLDPTKLAVNAKPTIVTRGVAVGYSLPLYAADEELFYQTCVLSRWDGVSDIHIHIHAWLDTAQDEAADAVNLTLEWEHFSVGEVVPDTNNTIEVEVVTGVVAQYTVLQFDFTIDHDIDIGDIMLSDDEIEFRLYRTASSHEIAGEIVICHAGVLFRCDKFGSPTSG